jgi:hypothetical protein
LVTSELCALDLLSITRQDGIGNLVRPEESGVIDLGLIEASSASSYSAVQ